MSEQLDRFFSDRLLKSGWVRVGNVFYPPVEKPKQKEDKDNA